MTGEEQRGDRQRQRSEEQEQAYRERFELLHHISTILEPVMIGLGIVFLVLLLMEYAAIPLDILGEDRLGTILQAIWFIFLIDFLLRLLIAPAKVAYLRTNWLGAISLALPFLRPLRAFRAARALRGFSLVRLLGAINRGMRALRTITRGRLMLYVAALTLVVVLAGAVGVQFFDRAHAESPVRSFDDALWWSAALVTTMNSELYVVSNEARVIGFLQRLYALSIFGYITASIASYLIGMDVSHSRQRDDAEQDAILVELGRLRREVRVLSTAVQDRHGAETVDFSEGSGE